MLKVALSHDVDRIKKHYQYFTNSFKSLFKGNIKNALYHYSSCFGPEPYWNFPEIMKIEENYGVRSTFFILDETIPFKAFDRKNWQLSLGRYKIDNPKIVDAVKTLDKNGWEIGVHGSYLSYNNEQLLKKEKENIENIIGHEIIGTRQHYLNWDKTTWGIQKNLGFKYDSTWGLTDGIGFKEGKALSFRPFNDYFIEIPLTVMDIPFMATTNRWEKFNSILDEIEQKDGVLVINWHHRVYKEKEFPGFNSSYHRIIKECLARNAKFNTMSEIYQQLNKDLP